MRKMDIEIDIDSEIPIFTQLINQIKLGVSNQQLKPGSPIPSIRKLAKELGLNPNTVSKAYKLLERDKIIIGKGYRGTFIHEDAVQYCDVNLQSLASAKMKETIHFLREQGLTDSEIRISFAESIKEKGI